MPGIAVCVTVNNTFWIQLQAVDTAITIGTRISGFHGNCDGGCQGVVTLSVGTQISGIVVTGESLPTKVTCVKLPVLSLSQLPWLLVLLIEEFLIPTAHALEAAS